MLYVQKIIIKMDSFELNKIIAAILMVALLIIGIGKISDAIFYVEKPELSGYKVEVVENSCLMLLLTLSAAHAADRLSACHASIGGPPFHGPPIRAMPRVVSRRGR